MAAMTPARKRIAIAIVVLGGALIAERVIELSGADEPVVEAAVPRRVRSASAMAPGQGGATALRFDAAMADPANHIILPEIISKEPLGPAVRHGDNNWGDIVRWTYFALLKAEEKGITKANIDEVATATQDPEVRRLLGLEGDMGQMLGLDPDWAKRAIAASGNYGEIFEANIGIDTPVKLARGLNALWTQGGLQYTPPFR